MPSQSGRCHGQKPQAPRQLQSLTVSAGVVARDATCQLLITPNVSDCTLEFLQGPLRFSRPGRAVAAPLPAPGKSLLTRAASRSGNTEVSFPASDRNPCSVPVHHQHFSANTNRTN